MNGAHQKISASQLHYLPSSQMHPANTRFHFSFANYYDPTRMGFGALRVLNDDEIKPHSGFGRHQHKNMEIISYVVKGKLTHWDSVTQKEATIGRGYVQAISSGTGVWHTEMNKQSQWCRLLQIWITPQKRGGNARYNQQGFELKDRENKLLHIVGRANTTNKAPLYINADVNFYASELTDSRVVVEFELKAGRQAYINCVEGSVHIDGFPALNERDSLAITTPTRLKIMLKGNHAHVIVIEMKKSKK